MLKWFFLLGHFWLNQIFRSLKSPKFKTKRKVLETFFLIDTWCKVGGSGCIDVVVYEQSLAEFSHQILDGCSLLNGWVGGGVGLVVFGQGGRWSHVAVPSTLYTPSPTSKGKFCNDPWLVADGRGFQGLAANVGWQNLKTIFVLNSSSTCLNGRIVELKRKK